MAQPRTSIAHEAPPPAPTPVSAWRVTDDLAEERAANGEEGPARRLQSELERALAGAPIEARWSPRRSLAFMVVSNAALWGGVIMALRAA